MSMSSLNSLPDDGPALGNTPALGRRELALALGQALARLLIAGVLIAFMMSLVPERPDGTMAFPLMIAVVGITWYVWFFQHQVKGVYKAKYPTLRAAEALILVAAMFLAIFSMIYVMISVTDPAAFTEVLTTFSAYYFALTVLATVGFGDIAPTTVLARSVSMVQMGLDVVFIAVLIRVMGGAAKKALQERTKPADDTTDKGNP